MNSLYTIFMQMARENFKGKFKILHLVAINSIYVGENCNKLNENVQN